MSLHFLRVWLKKRAEGSRCCETARHAADMGDEDPSDGAFDGGLYASGVYASGVDHGQVRARGHAVSGCGGDGRQLEVPGQQLGDSRGGMIR